MLFSLMYVFSCYFIMFVYVNMSLTTVLSSLGCKLLVYPGTLNMTSGPKHWELLTRSRLVVNIYISFIGNHFVYVHMYYVYIKYIKCANSI